MQSIGRWRSDGTLISNLNCRHWVRSTIILIAHRYRRQTTTTMSCRFETNCYSLHWRLQRVKLICSFGNEMYQLRFVIVRLCSFDFLGLQRCLSLFHLSFNNMVHRYFVTTTLMMIVCNSLLIDCWTPALVFQWIRFWRKSILIRRQCRHRRTKQYQQNLHYNLLPLNWQTELHFHRNVVQRFKNNCTQPLFRTIIPHQLLWLLIRQQQRQPINYHVIQKF